MKNICFITGRLTRDIEIRAEGRAMLTVTFSERDQSGNESNPEHYNVFCSEQTARYLINKGYKKGDTVHVTGKIRYRQKVDAATGQQTYHFSITIPNRPPYGIDGGVFKNEAYASQPNASAGHYAQPPQQHPYPPQNSGYNQQPAQQQMAMPQTPQQSQYPQQQPPAQAPMNNGAGNFSDIRAAQEAMPTAQLSDEDVDFD